MRKIVIVIISVLLMILVSIIIILNKNKENSDINNTFIESESKIEHNYYGYNQPGEFELGYLLACKGTDWSKYPLTEEFKKKYNSNDGILGDLQYDNIEYRLYANSIEDYYFKDYNCYFVITVGKSKTAYIYYDRYNTTSEKLVDVDILEIVNLYDENGDRIKVYGQRINNENWVSKFKDLAWGHEEERSVAVTDAFHRKYPYFLDLFIHYSPLTFNHIEFVPERSSWERKEAYFIVNSQLECKKRYYKVKFTLDNRGYLDDVKVNKVNEEEYDNNERDGGLHIFYLNSNWNGLNLTDNFRKKFSPDKGVFPDIKLLGNNFSFSSESKEYKQVSLDGDAKVNQIRGFKISNSYKYYLYKVYKDEQGNIDDIIYEKLPYENISIEEAKELYLKDYNN